VGLRCPVSFARFGLIVFCQGVLDISSHCRRPCVAATRATTSLSNRPISSSPKHVFAFCSSSTSTRPQRSFRSLCGQYWVDHAERVITYRRYAQTPLQTRESSLCELGVDIRYNFESIRDLRSSFFSQQGFITLCCTTLFPLCGRMAHHYMFAGSK
jgi:hypothetical protein